MEMFRVSFTSHFVIISIFFVIFNLHNMPIVSCSNFLKLPVHNYHHQNTFLLEEMSLKLLICAGTF